MLGGAPMTALHFRGLKAWNLRKKKLNLKCVRRDTNGVRANIPVDIVHSKGTSLKLV